MPEKVIITTQDNNTYRFIPAKKTESGDFSPCNLKDSFFANGSTCNVFLALDENKKRYLIKQHKPRFNNTTSAMISNVIKRYNKQGDNYILGDFCNGKGYLENGDENDELNYQVFKYNEGSVLEPYKGEESIFNNVNVLYSTLLNFVSFLHSLKLLHAEVDGESFLHLDIKFNNTVCLTINKTKIVQLIDFDSIVSKQDLIKAIENGVPYNRLIKTTSKYYSNVDIKKLYELSGKELQKSVYRLDTTAAVKLLSDMLIGNVKFKPSQRDRTLLDKNEALQTALYNFFEKGLGDFSERFSNVDEMINHISAIIASISDSLPATVKIEKLKAISQSSIINGLRDHYCKKNNLDNATREDIFIKGNLLKDIDSRILPYIKKDGCNQIIQGNEEVSALEQLLQEKKNYIISASAGHGKSTSLLQAFLRNIEDIENNSLYIYVPLEEYSGTDLINFISDNSGIRFNELIQQENSKITLLLDAYDEIKCRKRMNDTELADFDSKFFHDLSDLKNIESVIITSRDSSFYTALSPKDTESNQTFLLASLCPIESSIIEENLNAIDESAYSLVKKKKNLLTMLSNPLFLIIFTSLLSNHSEDIFHVSNEVHLMDLYFKDLYDLKYGLNTSKSECYEETIQYIGNYYCFHGKRNALAEEKATCFNSIVDFNKEKKWYGIYEYHISMNHALFRDYFMAIGLKQKWKSLTDKVYCYYNGSKLELREDYRSTKYQLKRKIKKEIIDFDLQLRCLADRDINEDSEKSRSIEFDRVPLFDEFYYKSLAYYFKKAQLYQELELLYNFLSNEMQDSDFYINGKTLMCDELFWIFSAYKSLNQSHQKFDLKYYKKSKHLGGYRGKTIAKIISAEVLFGIIGFLLLIYYGIISVLNINSIPWTAWVLPAICLTISIMILISQLLFVIIKRLRPFDVSKNKSLWVTKAYFETNRINGKYKKCKNACIWNSYQIKRVLFGTGMKTISNVSITNTEKLTSIWIPDTIKVIERVDLPNFNGQIHYGGLVEQWQNINCKDCNGFEIVFCRDGIVIPTDSTVLYYNEIINKFDLSEDVILDELKNFIQKKSNLSLMESIEELINLYYDNYSTPKSRVIYLAYIYKLKNITDEEFETLAC